jgi:hypothetical protein
MALNPKEVAELHHLVKTLLENWMNTKLAIQRAFGKNPITQEQESAFLKLKSDLSRTYRIVSDRLPKDLQFEGDAMIEMMKNATTMEHLHALPLSEKRNVFSKWHEIYIKMTRTFGALEVINEGYYPRLHRDLLRAPGSQGKPGQKGPAPKKAGSH